MSEQPTAARRSRFTPLRAAQLHGAVLGLLREVGYDALSMDAVAARARFSKATLYRQWGGKPQLVVAALQFHRPMRIDTIDTGSLRGDLDALAALTGHRAVAGDVALQLGVGRAIYDHPELRRTLREVMLHPALDDLHAILQRGVDRGEVAPDCPALDMVPRLLCSLVIARPLLSDEAMTETEFRRNLEALVFPALHI
ncbi:TetR/AcrR family transcriptional regulator [Streptomyces sp. NPDC002491]